MSVNFQSFKRIYNPKTGRVQFQKWDGGVFYDSQRQITPKIAYEPGVTGGGQQPIKKGSVKENLKTVEEEAKDVGDAILKRLKIRNGGEIQKGTIEERLKKIIKGSGIQTM